MLIRLINESVSVQSFRERLRTIIKAVGESMNIAESIFKFKHIIPKINEGISLATSFYFPMGKVYVVINNMSIGEIRLRVRSLKRMINNTVNIAETLASNLQEGLVKTTRTVGTFVKGKTVRVSDKTKDVKLEDKSNIVKLADRIKNIKLFKRGKGVRGV